MNTYDIDDMLNRYFGKGDGANPGDEGNPAGMADSMSTMPTTFRRFSDILAAPLTWLWPDWIPAGMLTVLGGPAGDGKSTVVASLVALLTGGDTLPDDTVATPVNVLIISPDGDPARVLRPRLDANGADPARVFILDGADAVRPFSRQGLRRMLNIIVEHRIRLVVIDPLDRLIRTGERTADDTLAAILALMITTGVAVLGVMRTSKAGPARRVAERFIASSSIPGVARSVLMLASVPGTGEGEGFSVLEVVKGNYASLPEPLALRMDAEGTVTWVGPASAHIDEVPEAANDPRTGSTEREDAREFLREFLADRPVEAVTVLQQARELGFSEITIRRAKKDLGITSYRDGLVRAQWMWLLPGVDKDAQWDDLLSQLEKLPPIASPMMISPET